MKRANQTGITLIEVLVTLVILSIGLLGSLRMQLLSIRSNTDAGIISQATIMTNDFAERIRINRLAARAGKYQNSDANYSTIACGTLPTEPCWDRNGATATQCNSDQMATSDAWRWVCSVKTQIPDPDAMVIWDAPSVSYTITLTWDSIDLNGQAIDPRPSVAIKLVP